jgi:predicted RNA-binding Zn-ribbon protein involved in translation (DUF1610 family)
MTNKEMLYMFCSGSDGRFLGPFTIGKYTYASDGQTCIRINKRHDTPEIEESNILYHHAKLFEGIQDIENWEKAPSININSWAECDYCKGIGKVYECPECDGEGSFEFSNSYNYYEVTCKSCDGSSFISHDPGEETQKFFCPTCKGLGKFKDSSIKINNITIGQIELARIMKLPNLLVYGEKTDFLRFKFDVKFDGGYGLVRRYA